jgi:hypothetical protein
MQVFIFSITFEPLQLEVTRTKYKGRLPVLGLVRTDIARLTGNSRRYACISLLMHTNLLFSDDELACLTLWHFSIREL